MRRRILVAILSITGVAVLLFGIPLSVVVDRLVEEDATLRIERQAVLAAREIPADYATADGVETGAQADVLIALGCIRHQGHLYSRALPASEFDTYLVRAMTERFEQQIGATSGRPAEDYPSWPDGNA